MASLGWVKAGCFLGVTGLTSRGAGLSSLGIDFGAVFGDAGGVTLRLVGSLGAIFGDAGGVTLSLVGSLEGTVQRFITGFELELRIGCSELCKSLCGEVVAGMPDTFPSDVGGKVGVTGPGTGSTGDIVWKGLTDGKLPK